MEFYEEWLQKQKKKPCSASESQEKNPFKAVENLLPDGCPIKTGRSCPLECRFTQQCFLEMIDEGVLPAPEVGCPLLPVCGLKR